MATFIGIAEITSYHNAWNKFQRVLGNIATGTNATQPLVQRAARGISPGEGLKRPVHETGHSPPPSVWNLYMHSLYISMSCWSTGQFCLYILLLLGSVHSPTGYINKYLYVFTCVWKGGLIWQQCLTNRTDSNFEIYEDILSPPQTVIRRSPKMAAAAAPAHFGSYTGCLQVPRFWC
jgi:hypothetical protein